MFGFDKPEDGSEERFHDRVSTWLNGAAPRPYRSSMPWLEHYFWWLTHNLVAHPLIGIAPIKPSFQFHDWTSRKLNGF